MDYIDISREISAGVAVYEGDDPIEHALVCDTADDSPCRITALGGWTTHLLTHVDAPRHFLAHGATLDQIKLARFSGPAVVVEVAGATVEPSDIPENVQGKAVLFSTSNSTLDTSVFHQDYVALSAAAVAKLVSLRPNLVGIDYLSVDAYGDEQFPAHRGLLGADVLILEGLNLRGVAPGEYELVALPLKIAGADGSPVRAALRR